MNFVIKILKILKMTGGYKCVFLWFLPVSYGKFYSCFFLTQISLQLYVKLSCSLWFEIQFTCFSIILLLCNIYIYVFSTFLENQFINITPKNTQLSHPIWSYDDVSSSKIVQNSLWNRYIPRNNVHISLE